MFRFTIRDVLWLMAAVGMGVGWSIEHRSGERVARRAEERVLQWLGKNSYWVRQSGGRHMARPLPPVMDWNEWIAEGKQIPNVEPALRTLLAKGDARVELPQVAECLGALGNSDSVPVLIDCLSRENMRLRLEAAVALGRLGHQRAVAPLGEILLSDWSENVRANAVTALQRLGGAEAMSNIEAAVSDENSLVSDTAKEAIEAYKRGARY